MRYHPDDHQHCSIRLKNYNYTQLGAYLLLGHLAEHYPVKTDAFIVKPQG